MSADTVPDYGLLRIAGTDPDHAIVLLHGIMQTRDLMLPFGLALAAESGTASVYVYGYDHTRGLEHNGDVLASTLATLTHMRIDLVGYSMGGLVARLAASAPGGPLVHTVVTLATPNRGALSNAELETLGQLGQFAFRLLSPLFPRSEGVKDLTRVTDIMERRYRTMISSPVILHTRYASIPALFYSRDRAEHDMGPSGKMAAVNGAMYAVNLVRKVFKMSRAHDGIVTEDSNNLTLRSGSDWNETLLAYGDGPESQPCVHAAVLACRDADHQSILHDPDDKDRGNAEVAALIGLLLAEPDWATLKRRRPTARPIVQIFFP